MRERDWNIRLAAIALFLAALVFVILGTRQTPESTSSSTSQAETTALSPARIELQSERKPAPAAISPQPTPTPSITPVPEVTVTPTPAPVTPPPQQPVSTYSFITTTAFKKFQPRYQIAWADPSNYGDRYSTDINGKPATNQPIIVLHETSNSAQSAINTFRNSHPNDENQVSYHTLITLDGIIVYLVPPEKRAYGAGNSVFDGPNGEETVQTNPNLPPSVNNFAYHVSLETPPDGWNQTSETTHSGYTEAQYEALAWLIAQSSVPDNRITTHRAVDRSGQRIDPRSFDFDRFYSLLHTFRQPSSGNS